MCCARALASGGTSNRLATTHVRAPHKQGNRQAVKAISLWQPWASLWLSDSKVHETRHWTTRYRGILLVHAAKRPIDDCDDAVRVVCVKQFGLDYRAGLPRGALIGIVRLTTVLPTVNDWNDNAAHAADKVCGDWSPGRFAWRRDDFLAFDRPIPWRGSQGLFDVPDDAVPAQVAVVEDRA
jgi:activating signal cointegrator 1